MRKNKEVFLYGDGFLLGSVLTQSRVDITNDDQPPSPTAPSKGCSMKCASINAPSAVKNSRNSTTAPIK